jgi:hypothetical protein
MLRGDRNKRNLRTFWVVVIGCMVGGLLSRLADLFLPESAARDFLITAVSGSIGPISMDLVVVGVTLGPLFVTLNALTLLGIALVAAVARTLL